MAENRYWNPFDGGDDYTSRADQGAIEANYDQLHGEPMTVDAGGRAQRARGVRLSDIRAKYAKRRQE